MGIRINTNIVALTAHRNLQINDEALSKSLERLSSGLRINRAADDAAGLAIAEKFHSQTTGIKVATQNAQDGISMIQTADGALGETESILQRMRELAVEGANDTLTASDRGHINDEMLALSSEIDRIANATQFNTQVLLNGGGNINGTGITLQVGANAAQVVNVQIDTATAAALGATIGALCVASSSFASIAIANVDAAINQLMTFRSRLGALQNRMQHMVANLSVQGENMAAAESQIRDLDMASEVAAMTRAQVLNQSSTAMLAQANQAPQSVLSLLK